MSIDNTDIYRTVVEVKVPGRSTYTYVFGPHDSKSQNKDYSYNSYWSSNNPRRITKQQLVAWSDEEYYGTPSTGLTWKSYSVTYKNGGEDVNWDE